MDTYRVFEIEPVPEWLTIATRPNFILRSSRIRVDLLSYESIPTDKRWQYDWRAEKNLDGYSKVANYEDY